MPLLFILSMPSNNSWNGRWSGEENVYAKTRPMPRSAKKKDQVIGTHYHNFGDGWCAAVECRAVTTAEARKIMKFSRGFCGYDWMINSIMLYGEIKP